MKGLFQTLFQRKQMQTRKQVQTQYPIVLNTPIFPPITCKQKFMRNTIDDIISLEGAKESDLAKLEVQKLITYLRNEYGF